MLRKSLFTPLLFISFVLTSCEFRCSMGDSAADEKTKPVEKDGMALYNGIDVKTKGVQLNKAYLITNDGKAERIGEGNFVDTKRGVKMILLIKDGWQETDGKVFLGASMKVVTDSGQTMLDEEDLFGANDEKGLSPADAKALGLSVTLKSLVISQPVSFNVTFKVWDKKGDGLIEGSYMFHTK